MTPTVDQWRRALGARLDRAAQWAPWLQDAVDSFDIAAPLRLAAFCATVGHETLGLFYSREVWGPTDAQERYERDPAAAWPPTDADDTNRLAWTLGNSEPGDGLLYAGRGLFQLTGRANYRAATAALHILGAPDFEANPDRAEEPRWASITAGWYWSTHGISHYADAEDFDGVSDLVNRGRKTPRVGDSNGYTDRLARYRVARAVLGVPL